MYYRKLNVAGQAGWIEDDQEVDEPVLDNEAKQWILLVIEEHSDDE